MHAGVAVKIVTLYAALPMMFDVNLTGTKVMANQAENWPIPTQSISNNDE